MAYEFGMFWCRFLLMFAFWIWTAMAFGIKELTLWWVAGWFAGLAVYHILAWQIEAACKVNRAKRDIRISATCIGKAGDQ